MSKIWLLENILQTPLTISALLGNVKKQHLFIREHLQPELTAAKKINDGSLDEKDFKKITHYYGLAVPAIIGEQIAALRGTSMTQRERLALMYQGAMTGLGDDFFDKQGTSVETVKAFIEDPEQLTGHTANEKLFLSFYKKLLGYVDDVDLMRKYLRTVFIAQVESRKQTAPGLGREELLKITLDKGGTSLLFYRAAMSHPFRKGEEEALYKIGGLMQFGNDVFGVYDDRNENISTLLTTTQKIAEIRTIFRSVMDDGFAAVYNAGYPKNNVKKFLRLFSMSLCSRCFVCFDQLEKKEATTNNVFSPGQYSRSDLVCDMDKAGNKWKSVAWHMKHKLSN